MNVEAQFISTIAGSDTTGWGNGSFSGDGGLAIAARLNAPYKIYLDAAGNIYVTDCGNHRVRKINENGIITTIAGNGNKGFSGDGGLAIKAELEFPAGVCVDASGNVYISDLGNNRVRKVNTSGIINTIAGSGAAGYGFGGYSGDGGLAVSSTLNSPISMIVDAMGNIFIADTYNHVIRKVDTNGIINTIAGTGFQGYSGDGGQATAAALNDPRDLTINAAGDLLIAEFGNNCIRKVNGAGIITTIAGNGNPAYSGDGGPAINAELDRPIDVDVDAVSNIYITDTYNHCIRKIDTNGIISTIAGTGAHGYSGDGGLATAANFFWPSGMVYNNDKIYVLDQLNHRIRMICSSTVSVSLSASDTMVCPGNPVTLTASGANTYTYTWSSTQTGINNVSVTPGVTADYYVQVKDTNGCVGSSSITLFVDACLGAEELANGGQVKIYPNPTLSELNISDISFVSQTSKITIVNSLGQVVRSISISENFTGVYKIDVTDLKNGLYFVSIENDSKVTSKLFNKIE